MHISNMLSVVLIMSVTVYLKFHVVEIAIILSIRDIRRIIQI